MLFFSCNVYFLPLDVATSLMLSIGMSYQYSWIKIKTTRIEMLQNNKNDVIACPWRGTTLL